MVAALLIFLLGLGASGAFAAGTGGFRLSGGFFQYNDALAAWPSTSWVQVLESMREVKMDTVIVQMLAREEGNGSTYSFMRPAGQNDPTETILSYADTNGFKIYLGLYLSRWFSSMTDSNLLARLTRENVAIATQAHARYLQGGRHPSFAGWYLPYESWTANYTAAEVAALRGFFAAVSQGCKALTPGAPVSISPFISADRPGPARVEQLYTEILRDSGIGILMLQDSVGAQGWTSNIPQRVQPYAAAFQRACATNRVQFWGNLETFEISSGIFQSCEVARLKTQFDAMGPYGENFITFDFVHYMNPSVFLSSWNTTRRARMKALYDGYKSQFITKPYAPLAPPRINPQMEQGQLKLQWPAQPDDRFEVEGKTNLLGALWLPVATTIEGSNEMRSASVSLNESTPGFFRVTRFPRLVVADSMIRIPAGTFLMGTPATDTNVTFSELPAFSVTLTRDFWVSSHEVTQSEYQNIMETNPSLTRGSLELPVEYVSWNEATQYCAKLTAYERGMGRLPSEYAYRLPTEAEWEYATRAGSSSWFCFGNDPALLSACGWYTTNAGGLPHAVASLAPNAWGLYDVHGNVMEWCLDWLGSEPPPDPVVDPIGTANDAVRCARGGAWSSSWVRCRSSWRTGFGRTRKSNELGFRVVLAPILP